MQRRHLLGLIAAASMGGGFNEPLLPLLDGLARPPQDAHRRVGGVEVAAVHETGDLVTRLDLQFGGGVAAQVAHGSLRWAVGLLDGSMTDDVRTHLCSAVAALADRVAWSTYDTGDNAAATRLWTLALDAAARGGDRDLRGHVLLNLSTLLSDTGRGADAVETLSLALGDERVSRPERANLHAVCARHAAGIGERNLALRHLGLVDEEMNKADLVVATPAWAARITGNSGHFAAATGMAWHALGEQDRAHGYLTAALASLGSSRARTGLRCRTRLAVIHLRDGDVTGATRHAQEAIAEASTVRSVRVLADLAVLRDAARERGLADLASEVDAALRGGSDAESA